jgi:alpha-D-ribose 1-methylphosphonate 5-triphosphate diphosphatase
MKSLLIKNATVVTPDETINKCSIKIEYGIITEIGNSINELGLPIIDAKDSFAIPGIIDIHTDALEMEINPRPRADMPIAVAFRELERKMSGCGFTTVFHSLHLGYKNGEDAVRSKYSRREVFEKVHALSQDQTLLKNKIHLRFELSGVYAYDTCVELIEGGFVSLLSVMDHTPGQGQQSFDKFIDFCMRNGKTEEAAKRELDEMLSRPKIEGEKLATLIGLARKNHISVASHDDDSIEKVKAMQALGINICEFPITMAAAVYASQAGMHVVGGASNILRGGSLSDNLDIRDAINSRAINLLCSDYYPPSILHSIWKLVGEDDLSWSEAVKLTSLNPAKAVSMQHQTGSIEVGKAADIIVVKTVGGVPLVTHTIVDGNIVSQASVKRHYQKEEIWL